MGIAKRLYHKSVIDKEPLTLEEKRFFKMIPSKRNKKHKQNNPQLKKLIDEQSAELRAEQKFVHVKGQTNGFQKGFTGIFVGNKIF